MNPERKAKGLYWDKAWKLVEGCTKVSPGCDNCWSETETVMRSNHNNEKIRTRAKAVVVPPGSNAESPAMLDDCGFDGRITMRHDNLDLPLRTKKPTVFAVWNDLFHEDVSDEFRDRAYAVMALCPQHTFLVLTKRAENLSRFFTSRPLLGLVSFLTEKIRGCHEWPPPNVWHGVTVENQEQADARILYLLRVPGKRFLSVEPMLSDVDIDEWLFEIEDHLIGPDSERDEVPSNNINAVLCGGESGKAARPMHPDWVRSLRDQCESAGVPFFFKQWGEFVTAETCPDEIDLPDPDRASEIDPDGRAYFRVGKKKAGRLLDGKLHDDLPWDGGAA